MESTFAISSLAQDLGATGLFWGGTSDWSYPGMGALCTVMLVQECAKLLSSNFYQFTETGRSQASWGAFQSHSPAHSHVLQRSCAEDKKLSINYAL